MGTSLTSTSRQAARLALVLLWLGTALVSCIELNGQSQALLQNTRLPANWQAPITGGGALLDAALGLAIWRRHSRSVYLAAGATMLIMTLIASALLPALWLDPLGCLSKNLPIAALLFILYQDARP